LRNKNRNRIKAKATSLTALLVSLLILSVLVGAQFVEEVSAINYTEYTGTLEGADWALRIPDPWNGMLVIICRGTVPRIAPMPNPSFTLSYGSTMIEQGFAVAASNYGELGLCVQQGVSSTYEATRHIIENYDISGKVFLYGISLGGCVALLLGEKYPDVYSGVLDLFGVKDLKDRYTTNMRWANLTDEELAAELTALNIPVPPYGHSTLQEFRNRCANASRSTVLETGGTPETHPQEYEDRSPTYHANIMIPVITVHGTGDALVPHYRSLMYQTAVENAGRSSLYRLYNVTGGGHAEDIVMAEVPAHFDELVAWSNALTGGPTDWPMFRHDLQHSGYSESPAPNTNQTLWTYTTGGMGVFSSPAVADGKVYVGADDNKVHCVDASTGTFIWYYTTGDGVVSAPAVVDGKVYVGSVDDNVYCFDALTGAKIWNYTTGDNVFSPPAVVDSRVYIGSHDSKLYCLRADDGKVEWNFTTGGQVWSSPAVADGRVYFGSLDRKVYCVDAATGALIWNYTAGNELRSTAAVVNGRIYISSSDNNVYCLDAATGSKIWSYTTGGEAYTPAIADGKVYVGSEDDNLYCLDAATGALEWNYTTGGDVISPPAVADSKVYVGSFDNNVYCLDATTGAFIWSYTTGGPIVGSPAVANGVVYVGSADREVYAFSTWVPIPEGLTIGVMLLLLTVAAIVGIHCLCKRPKLERF
jgi:outer membrane protein assembly factor BamB